MSASMESLEEGTEGAEFEDDPDLQLRPNEPEAWSVTVDKKTLKKMSAKDIKRQDHIWGRVLICVWVEKYCFKLVNNWLT